MKSPIRSIIQDRLETFYKMPLEKIISEIHWKQQKSIKAMATESGICRQSIMHLCKASGIELRKHHASILLQDRRKEKHWSWGMTKETSPTHRAASERMKSKNPIHNPDVAIRRAKTVAVKYKNNPLPQEVMFETFLNKMKMRFIPQHQIGPYVIDFFLPSKRICIEIDSTRKWGHHRRFKSLEKDEYLKAQNYKVIRLDKTWLAGMSALFDIL